MKTEHPDNLALVAELARASTAVDVIKLPLELEGVPDGIQFAVHRGTGQIINVIGEIERARFHPARRKGNATALTLQSLIDMVNRHKSESSAIFANTAAAAPSVLAVINYHHRPEQHHLPDFCDHRIAYKFPLSAEWQAWAKADGQSMDQQDFAAFIEDHIMELTSPLGTESQEFSALAQTSIATPAEMLALSRGMAVTAQATIKNTRSLSSGEGEITFTEEHRDLAGQKLLVPGLFFIHLPIFDRATPTRIPVRLRYRASGGAIKWAFNIWRPEIWVTERVKEDLLILARDTGLPVFEGMPEQ